METLTKYTRPDDVRRILLALIQSDAQLSIWQNLQGKRTPQVTIYAKNMVWDERIYIFSDGPFDHLTKGKDLYLRHLQKPIVCKVPLLKIGQGFLETGKPLEVLLQNTRGHHRIHYFEQSNSITFTKKNRNATFTTFSVPLFDLSSHGASAVLNANQAMNIEAGEQIKITAIQGSLRLKPIQGCHAVYLQKINLKGSAKYKLGIRLGRELNSSEFPRAYTH